MQITSNDEVWIDSDIEPIRRRFDWTDLAFLLALVIGAAYAMMRADAVMDVYDRAILIGAVPTLAWLAWLWRPLRRLMIALACTAGLALLLYGGNLARADEAFLLRYLLSSQSAIMWMCAWPHFLTGSD